MLLVVTTEKQGCCWGLGGTEQQCCWTSYSAQHSPTGNHPTSNVSSAESEKPWASPPSQHSKDQNTFTNCSCTPNGISHVPAGNSIAKGNSPLARLIPGQPTLTLHDYCFLFQLFSETSTSNILDFHYGWNITLPCFTKPEKSIQAVCSLS